MTLIREMKFLPAWDRRKEGFGIHCVDCRMVVTGPLGSVQFVFSTGWMLMKNKPIPEKISDMFPMGVDVGYHSPVPRYEGQEPMKGECEFVPGGKCYYDGSGLQAMDWVEILIEQGSDKIWELLELRYKEIFEDEDESN